MIISLLQEHSAVDKPKLHLCLSSHRLIIYFSLLFFINSQLNIKYAFNHISAVIAAAATTNNSTRN